jgi:exopolyphosphatase/guanosine-5'-triphosphate,3'-diphosphate pyrophosphatase
VGLGQGVDETGRFAPEAVERTLQACREYAAIIQEHHCDKVRFIATSATRDAANRDELLDGVRAILGVDPEVISGDEESRLSFAGALSGAADPLAPVLVMDSGGGSTELVLGGADGTVSSAASIDVGSRRVKERCLRNDPPTAREIAEARDMVSAALDASPVPVATANTFIGVAGTVTSLAALALGLTEYDRARVHGSAIPIATLDELTDRLLASTSAQIAALGPVTADRAAVLPAGALVVRAVAHRTRCELLIASEADILDGVALAMLST